MRRISVFALVALAAAALLSCEKKDNIENRVQREVRFTTSVGSYSIATKATDAALENGDKVRIVAGTPINATAVGTVSGTSLTLDTPIYWNADQTESTTFARSLIRDVLHVPSLLPTWAAYP